MQPQYVSHVRGEPCYSMLLIRPFVQALAATGRCKSKLALDLLKRSDEERVPVRVALDWLCDEVVQTTDVDLGLRVAGLLQRGAGDVVELVASTADTFGEALQLLLRYIRILNEAADFTLETRGQLAILELHSKVPLPRAAADFQMGAIVVAARAWLRMTDSFLVSFAHDRPKQAAAYSALLGPIPVRFGKRCDSLRFDSALLSQPLRTAAPALKKVLLCHAESTAASLVTSHRLAPNVRSLLHSLLPSGAADMDRVACELGVSRRTLTRRLQGEGVGFGELLENTRHLLALHYLGQTSLIAQEIAPLLGYSSAASFSRAFARWQGTNPIEYRLRYRKERAQSAVLDLEWQSI